MASPFVGIVATDDPLAPWVRTLGMGFDLVVMRMCGPAAAAPWAEPFVGTPSRVAKPDPILG
jgi:hypothetical protein